VRLIILHCFTTLFAKTYNDALEYVNPLTDTLKPQSNGPLYRNTVIGRLAVDEWAVTFGTIRI